MANPVGLVQVAGVDGAEDGGVASGTMGREGAEERQEVSFRWRGWRAVVRVSGMLTEKQRAMLERTIEDGGVIVLMNRSDTMIAKALAAMGLGETGFCFRINDAGRAAAAQASR